MGETDSNNKLVPKTNVQVAVQPVNLDYIKELANSIEDSELAEPFKTKNKDGQMVVSKGAIIANMVLAKEIGLDPVSGLTLGKKLNANSYLSVLRGRELGLDAISSMSKVYHIPTKNGSVIALAVDIIIAKILESGTEFEYIRDYEPTPTYKSLTNQYLGHKHLLTDDSGNFKSQYYLYQKDVTTKDQLTKAQQSGKIIIFQFGLTHVTSIRFKRKSNNIDMVVHYSLQEATDAGLFQGYHSTNIDEKGQPAFVKGKNNWNEHPATHLRHRPLSIGGRIVAADLLMGNYSVQEALEIIDSEKVNNEDDLVDYQYSQANDVEIIEEDKNK